jgi:hypothetical protein
MTKRKLTYEDLEEEFRKLKETEDGKKKLYRDFDNLLIEGKEYVSKKKGENITLTYDYPDSFGIDENMISKLVISGKGYISENYKKKKYEMSDFAIAKGKPHGYGYGYGHEHEHGQIDVQMKFNEVKGNVEIETIKNESKKEKEKEKEKKPIGDESFNREYDARFDWIREFKQDIQSENENEEKEVKVNVLVDEEKAFWIAEKTKNNKK